MCAAMPKVLMSTNRDDDPDETEGRRLYRDIADKLASYQVNMSKRRVRLADTKKPGMTPA